MKTILVFFALACLFIGIRADRIIVKGQDASDTYAYFSSLKYPIGQVPAGEENDLFAVVFGKGFPGVNSFPPSVAVTYARGSTTITDAGATFQGSLTGLLWSYFTLGEYCELNGTPGYQVNGDVLIQTSNWDVAQWNDIQSGELSGGVYWATLTEATGTFTYTCRLGASERVDGSISVGPYSLKCDVIVNATNYWAPITLCPASSRYIGLLAYVASGKVDVSAGANVNGNVDAQGQAQVTFDDAQSFLKWKTTFENGQTGVSYNVNAQVTDVPQSLTFPNGVSAVKQMIFSFLSPKSETSVFVWDPEMGVDVDRVNQANGQEQLAVFNLLIVALLAIAYVF